MRLLHLDFETRSRLNIKEVGLDNYARSADVLMLAWAIDNTDPAIWFPDEPLPEPLEESLSADTLCAWNSAFERSIFRHAMKRDYPIRRWHDPSVLARYASLPSRLAEASTVLRLGDDGKDKDGKRLIRKFSIPTSKGIFRDKHTDPADWQKFVNYCKQDVIAERTIHHKLSPFFDLPERERRLWELDQKINERGLPTDVEFVKTAYRLAGEEIAKLSAEQKALTGLENPNSVKQLLGWVKARGYPFESLGAKRIAEAMNK